MWSKSSRVADDCGTNGLDVYSAGEAQRIEIKDGAVATLVTPNVAKIGKVLKDRKAEELSDSKMTLVGVQVRDGCRYFQFSSECQRSKR